MSVMLGSSSSLWIILVLGFVSLLSANSEGDALIALKSNLLDPTDVLQSWDSSLVNPCTWFHVTCDSGNVTRIDLGNANLSGMLAPQLGQLQSLQYLELYSNNISGGIPEELGELTNLESLDLYSNNLTGPIPVRLGQLKKLRFLRLNNNSLSGTIPMSLTNVKSLQVLDLSFNQLTGDIPVTGSFSLFTPISFAHNNLNQSAVPTPPPPLPSSPSPASEATAAAALYLRRIRRLSPPPHTDKVAGAWASQMWLVAHSKPIEQPRFEPAPIS